MRLSAFPTPAIPLCSQHGDPVGSRTFMVSIKVRLANAEISATGPVTQPWLFSRVLACAGVHVHVCAPTHVCVCVCVLGWVLGGFYFAVGFFNISIRFSHYLMKCTVLD